MKTTSKKKSDPDHEFLTAEDLIARYRGKITKHTLDNWRSSGDGPPFTKVVGRVLYPVKALFEWERKQTRNK